MALSSCPATSLRPFTRRSLQSEGEVFSLRGAARASGYCQVRAHPPVGSGGVALNPPEARDVIHGPPALARHLFQVTVREEIPAIPSDAQKDDRRLEVTPLERGFILLQEYDSLRMMDEPKENSSSEASPVTEPPRRRRR